MHCNYNLLLQCILPKAVYSVKKCSWGWANLSPEICWADLKRLINEKVVTPCWLFTSSYFYYLHYWYKWISSFLHLAYLVNKQMSFFPLTQIMTFLIIKPIRCTTFSNFIQDGSWSSSQAVSKPVWYIPLLCVQWKTPDDGQRNCPKYVEFHSKNKIWEISASSWFYYKKFNRIHGHMNVKQIMTLR